MTTLTPDSHRRDAHFDAKAKASESGPPEHPTTNRSTPRTIRSTAWATARAAWDEVYNREGDLTLLKKVDDKPLFVHFYALEQKGATKAEVLETINKFVANTSVKNNVEGQ